MQQEKKFRIFQDIQVKIKLRETQNYVTKGFQNKKYISLYLKFHGIGRTLPTSFGIYPTGNYMIEVNNRNTRTRCEICSRLTIQTPEQRHWHRSGVFIVNYEHITFSTVSIVNFEQVNADWVGDV